MRGGERSILKIEAQLQANVVYVNCMDGARQIALTGTHLLWMGVLFSETHLLESNIHNTIMRVPLL